MTPPGEARANLLDRLRAEQRARWQGGERVPVKDLLLGHAELAEDVEAVLDLVLGEVLLRKQYGERPAAEEFAGAFPHCAERIREQLALHELFGLSDGPIPVATVPDHRPAAPAPPLAVPGYEILGELGRGGMGVVYKARQSGLNRLVALKVIRGGNCAGVEELARFRTEAETVARLAHPNIVQVYDVGEHDGSPFFSLEFCAGGSLDRQLSGTPLPAAKAARLVETLARAVQAAHDKDVLHRDLKPANVLLAEDGTPKVGDFGLAKRLDVSAATSTGRVMGTPSYMPPEQAQGKKDLGPTADVYALGALLYECLTGRPPFKAATEMETLLQVTQTEPVPPRRLNPTVPRDPETICLKCLQKEPTRRYPSAAALADDLARFLADRPIQARPIGRAERTIRWARRRPAVAGLLALLVCLAGAAIAVTTWLWNQERGMRNRAEEETRRKEAALRQAEQDRTNAEEAERRTRTALSRRTLDLAYQAWLGGDVARARWLLDQCPADRRGPEWHYVDKLCHADVRTFTLGGPVKRVGCSPDGTRLAVAGADSMIRLVDVRTGNVTTLSGHRARVLDVAFSPDGRFLASGSDDRTVRLWDVSAGTLVWELPTGGALLVAFHPDGKRLAVAWEEGIALWDVTRGERLPTQFPVTRPFNTVTFQLLSLAISPDGRWLAAGADDGVVRCWDAQTGAAQWTHEGNFHWWSGVAFSPDGKVLAASSWDATVTLREASTGKPLRTLRGHVGAVLGVAFSPDGRNLATAGLDQTVKVWETASGQECFTLRGHTGPVRSVTYAPDGQRLVSAGRRSEEDGAPSELKVWDATLAQELRPLQGVGAVTWPGSVLSQDGRRLVAVRGRNAVVVDAADGTECFAWKSEDVRAVAFGDNGRSLMAVVDPGGPTETRNLTLLEWDLDTKRQRRSVPLTGLSPFRDGALSPDGRRLAWGIRGARVDILEMGAGGARSVGRIDLGESGPAVEQLKWSPDGRRLAVVFSNRDIRLWDADGGRVLGPLAGPGPHLSDLAFSHDGRLLAAVSHNSFDAQVRVEGEIRFWDTTTGAPAGQLAGGGQCLAFSPDGRYFACTDGKNIRLWNTATPRQEILTIRLPNRPGIAFPSFEKIRSLAFGGDALFLRTWPSDSVWVLDDRLPAWAR